MDIENHIKTYLNDHVKTDSLDLLPVAVSGGADSMCLLESIRTVSSKLHVSPCVLHYNHRLSSFANRAERFLENWCSNNSIPFIGGSALDPERIKSSKRGLEAEARTFRYQFLAGVCRTLNVKSIMLAHHRKDQVETILLNIGRGSGLFGLQGMHTESDTLNEVILHRPLLSISQQQISNYVRTREIPFVTDPSNTNLDRTRNRIRHKILPQWDKAQPDPTQSIWRLSKQAKLENEFWEDYIQKNFVHWVWNQEIQFDRKKFKTEMVAAQNRFLHFIPRVLSDHGHGWSEANISEMRDFCLNANSGSFCSLPGPYRAIREYNRICVYRESAQTKSQNTSIRTAGANAKHAFDPGGVIKIHSDSPSHPPVKNNPKSFHSSLSVEKIYRGKIRQWKNGDCIHTSGKSKPLKEIFDTQRIPFRARRYWPIFTKNDSITCVPGLVKNENMSKNDGTSKTIIFEPKHPCYHQLIHGNS